MMNDAAKFNIVPTVENYPGADSPLVLAEDFLDWQREFPDLQLCFDDGNASGGGDPAENLRKCLPWLRHVHMKDWRIFDGPGERRVKMMDGRYYYPALIGEGVVNHAGVLEVLAQHNYQGCINLEYEENTIPPLEAMEKAMSFLNDLASKI